MDFEQACVGVAVSSSLWELDLKEMKKEQLQSL